MTRKTRSINLSIKEREKAQLEEIALEFGMKWGDRPNISKLMEAIARRQLLIGPNHDWSPERIAALEQARKVLVDAGHLTEATAIATLLLERSELTIPLRREIERFVEQPPHPWRLELEQYIRRQQPFRLAYRDAADRPWVFTIRYARITTHEQRQYLDCWCEETTGNQDLGELSHNWNLRLDRIPEAALNEIPGQWRSPGLDFIPVEMHLYRGLAFAYQTKTGEDDVNEWLTEPAQVKRVVRRVSSTFWFFREILRYGEDCQIIGPEMVRDRFKAKLQQIWQQYFV